MDFICIHVRYVPEGAPRRSPFHTIYDDAMAWVELRGAAAAVSLAAADVWRYLYTYRAPDVGSAKGGFFKRWFVLNEKMEEFYGMAKNSSKSVSNGGGALTFLNVRLTEEQLAEADGAKATPSQVLGLLYEAVQEGYALSFSYNAAKGQANAMLIDRREGSPTYLHALSAFSEDCADAVKLLVYKHVHICERNWVPYAGTSPERRVRG